MDRMLAVEGTQVDITAGMDRENPITLGMRDQETLITEADTQQMV